MLSLNHCRFNQFPEVAVLEVSDAEKLESAAGKGGGFASACGANLYNLRLTPFAYFPFAFHR